MREKERGRGWKSEGEGSGEAPQLGEREGGGEANNAWTERGRWTRRPGGDRESERQRRRQTEEGTGWRIEAGARRLVIAPVTV